MSSNVTVEQSTLTTFSMMLTENDTHHTHVGCHCQFKKTPAIQTLKLLQEVSVTKKGNSWWTRLNHELSTSILGKVASIPGAISGLADDISVDSYVASAISRLRATHLDGLIRNDPSLGISLYLQQGSTSNLQQGFAKLWKDVEVSQRIWHESISIRLWQKRFSIYNKKSLTHPCLNKPK